MTDISSSPTESPIQEVVDEAIELLQELVFDTGEGVSWQGERVIVSITPEPADQRCHVRVTCYAHGHRAVDWAGLRLGLTGGDTSADPQWLPLLNGRGQTRLAGLEPGGYAIVAYHRVRQRYQVLGTATEIVSHPIPVQTAIRTRYAWTFQTQQTRHPQHHRHALRDHRRPPPHHRPLSGAGHHLESRSAGNSPDFRNCCSQPGRNGGGILLFHPGRRYGGARPGSETGRLDRSRWRNDLARDMGGPLEPAEAFELNYRILPRANRLERDIVLPDGL